MIEGQKNRIVGLGSDHCGFGLKVKLLDFLNVQDIPVIDFGTYSNEPVDYPDIAEEVAESICLGLIKVGILVCGTGLGMSIAANKIPGVFAAPVWTREVSRLARQSNNANVISLGADHIGFNDACDICLWWLNSRFRGGNSERKVNKISHLEKRYSRNGQLVQMGR